jgi:uncharacterized damage-inducible protein DinB
MDTIELVKLMIAAARRHSDDALKDVTTAQFNWAPPGMANTISAIFVHYLISEDFFFQKIIQGKEQLWQKGHWSEKTGIKNTPDYGGNWDEFKHMTVNMAPVFDYQKAVRAATDVYLTTLTPEELDRKVNFSGSESTVAEMLILSARHTLSHAGEICILKGIQGVKVLSY